MIFHGVSFCDTKSLDPFARYMVSRCGRVFSKRSGKIIKGELIGGYICIDISKNRSSRKRIAAHRVIAEVFIPNPDGLPEVNHKNGIKVDNRASNLEWVTRSGNCAHAVKAGLVKRHKGYRANTSKHTRDIRGLIFDMYNCGLRISDIANVLGEEWSHIAYIIKVSKTI